MFDDLTFTVNKKATVAPSNKIAGWIMRTFKTSEKKPMMTVFRALTLPIEDYHWVLISLLNAGKLGKLACIDSVKDQTNWERLKTKLNPLGRR